MTARNRSDFVAVLRRHPLVAAYVAALAPALLMALTQPVWSPVDEAQHFDFVAQLSHGVYPIADTTYITPETLGISEATGSYRAYFAPGTYPVPDLADVGSVPAGMSPEANAVWMQRHMWQLSREAQQTPGYYLAMLPAWWLANALGGPFAALYALRIINALLLATLAPMAIVVAQRLMPARSEVAGLAALFAILVPGLDLNLARISNDTPAAVIGGLLVVLAASRVGTAWSWRRTVVAGLLMGAGLLVKLTVAGVFPAVALAMLWPASGTTWRGRIARGVVAGAIASFCLAPWLLANLHFYGGLMPGYRVSRMADSVPHALAPADIPLNLAVFAITYWTGEPWGALPLSGVMAVLGTLIALAAPAAVIQAIRTRAAAPPSGPLAVAVVAVVVMVGVTLALPAGFGFTFLGSGRYAYPALPAAAALCAAGVVTVLTGVLARRVLAAVYATLAGVMLVVGAAGWSPAPGPGTGAPPPDATVVAVAASGSASGLTITVDRVALDRSGKATWFHVTVENMGTDEVEWSTTPIASTARVEVAVDYLRSTHVAGDIDPHQSVTSWLHVALDPAALVGGETITLRFGDIAAPDYQALGDIVLQVPSPSA